MMRAGGETWIVGSYDPDLDLTYWGVAQAKPWMPASRGNRVNDAALYARLDGGAARHDGTLAWHYQHIPAKSLDLDEVFERVLVDLGPDKVVFTIGKAGILWKLDRRTGRFMGHRETVFQNVFTRIDPEDRGARVSRRHQEPEDRRVDRVVSEHRGRAQLAGDELSPGRRAAGRFRCRSRAWKLPAGRSSCKAGFRRYRRRAALLRDAGQRRQHRQAGRLRRQHAAAGVDPRPAGAVPDRRAVHRRRARVHRRSGALLPRAGRADRRRALGDAAQYRGAGLTR